MSSAARLRFLLAHAATVVFCTPSYALHLAEVAGVEGDRPGRIAGADARRRRRTGGSIPATRKRIEAAWGARLFDHYGLTEVGPTAIECLENPGGMHVHGPRLHRRGHRPGDRPSRSRRARSASWS